MNISLSQRLTDPGFGNNLFPSSSPSIAVPGGGNAGASFLQQQLQKRLSVMNATSANSNSNNMVPPYTKREQREVAAEKENRVASQWIVNDRTVSTSLPPQTMAVCRHQVWVSYNDGTVEVRNARTAEVIKRYMASAANLREVERNSDPFAAVGSRSDNNNNNNNNNNSSSNSRTTTPPPAFGGIFKAIPTTTSAVAGATSELMSTSRRALGIATDVNDKVIVNAMQLVEVRRSEPHMWLGLSNGSIEVFTAAGEYLRTQKKHERAVVCLAEFGGLAYSAAQDGTVLQWRADNGNYLRAFASTHGHEGCVGCMYAEGNALVTGGEDSTVKVWDIGAAAMELTGYFHSMGGGVSALCRVGEMMWSGDSAGQVVRWLMRTCEAVQLHKPHTARVTFLRKVGTRVYSGSADGTVGLHAADSGTLLQRLTDQSGGWLTTVAAPAQLSRFVVWSAGADGMVRCWYQDEYISLTGDHERLNDAAWYQSGSTPYREFRATLGRQNAELRNKIALAESRDHQAVQVLRRCSMAFNAGGGRGGAAGRDSIEGHLGRLKDQMSLAQQRKTKSENELQTKKSELDLLEMDMANVTSMLENAQRELQQLNSANPYGMSMAAPPPLPTNPYLSSSILQQNQTSSPPPPPAFSTTMDSRPLPPPLLDLSAADSASMEQHQPPLPPPLSPSLGLGLLSPTVGGGGADAVPLAGSILPLPSPQAPSVPTPTAFPTYAPTPMAAPPPLPAPDASASTAPGAYNPLTGTYNPPAYSPYSYSPYGLGAYPPPPQQQQQPIDPLTGLPYPDPSAAAAPPPAAPVLTPEEQEAERKKREAEEEAARRGVQWTNPNVGNYIQRRYYGAYPSLRTTDVQKEERKKHRVPVVKTVPFDRTRMMERIKKKKEKEEEERKRQLAAAAEQEKKNKKMTKKTETAHSNTTTTTTTTVETTTNNKTTAVIHLNNVHLGSSKASSGGSSTNSTNCPPLPTVVSSSDNKEGSKKDDPFSV